MKSLVVSEEEDDGEPGQREQLGARAQAMHG